MYVVGSGVKDLGWGLLMRFLTLLICLAAVLVGCASHPDLRVDKGHSNLGSSSVQISRVGGKAIVELIDPGRSGTVALSRPDEGWPSTLVFRMKVGSKNFPELYTATSYGGQEFKYITNDKSIYRVVRKAGVFSIEILSKDIPGDHDRIEFMWVMWLD